MAQGEELEKWKISFDFKFILNGLIVHYKDLNDNFFS